MKTTQHTPGLHHYNATIDGESVRGLRCFEASEEEGYIKCYFFTRTAGGGIRFYPDQDGQLRSYTRYGAVVITPPDPDALEDRSIRLAKRRLEARCTSL